MLPLKDDFAARGAAPVTLLLIGLNLAAFLYQLALSTGAPPEARAGEALVREFGLVPCRLSGRCADSGVPPAALTLFISMFLHGGAVHVGGNMLYLWIFGRSLEETLGHGGFLALYGLAGALGAVLETLAAPASAVPVIGASGAVSGVLGAYVLLFPGARVLVLVVIGFFVRLVRVPALLVLGLWAVVQVASALATDAAGVAWLAHLGGFAAGVAAGGLRRRACAVARPR